MISEKQKMITILLLVFSFLTYTLFIYTDLPIKHTDSGIAAQNGKLLWQQNNCNACHQIYGLGGYLGPDLTNVFSRRGEAFIKAFIKSGTAIMPKFPLSDLEINELSAFLKEIDASGNADPKSFIIHYDGTISQ